MSTQQYPKHSHHFTRPAFIDWDYKFGDVVIHVDQVPVKLCETCNEEVITAHDLGLLEIRIGHLIIANQLMNGQAFQFLRKVLPMSRKELAGRFGMPHDTMLAWELGEIPVPASEWLSLAGMFKIRHPSK